MKRIYSRVLTLAILLSASFATQAQDKIFLNNGDEISGKVTEVNSKNIVYKREDAPNGPDYVVPRKNVSRIKYENGTEEKMIASAAPMQQSSSSSPSEYTSAHKTSNHHPAVAYGKNIIAFAPIQMTNESPAGVGLSFEHFVDKDNVFSIYVPVAIAFYNDYAYQGPGTSYDKDRVYTYFYPGMKIYPGGSNRRVSYSVGPSFGLGFGTRYFERQTYDPITGYPTGYTYYEDNEFKAGFLVNNGLNIQPTQSLYVGLEFGLGIMYYASHSNAFDEPLVQLQFKMGYRF